MRVLVLSGGGSWGSFQVGAIQALVEQGHRWDAIAGVSVGAINAAFLAQFLKSNQPQAAQDLATFWSKIEGNKSIYKRWFPFGRLHSFWKGSLYDTSPLAALIYKNLSPGYLLTSGVRLLVGAVCLETGEYHYIEGTDPQIAEWVLASSAFPAVFTPRKINGQTWIDGGVRDVTPVTDVLHLDPEIVDVILTAPLGEPSGSLVTKKTQNVVHVGLRSVGLLAQEVFNGDLDRVPEVVRPRIHVYSPPLDLARPDALDFNPQDIARLYKAGLQVKS